MKVNRKDYEKSTHVPKIVKQEVALLQTALGAKVVGRKKVWPYPFRATKQAIACVQATYDISKTEAGRAAKLCEGFDLEAT